MTPYQENPQRFQGCLEALCQLIQQETIEKYTLSCLEILSYHLENNEGRSLSLRKLKEKKLYEPFFTHFKSLAVRINFPMKETKPKESCRIIVDHLRSHMPLYIDQKEIIQSIGELLKILVLTKPEVEGIVY